MFEVDLRTYATRRRVDPQIGDEVIIVGSSGEGVGDRRRDGAQARYHPKRDSARIRPVAPSAAVSLAEGRKDRGRPPFPKRRDACVCGWSRCAWCGFDALQRRFGAIRKEDSMTKPHIPLDEIRSAVESCRKCPLAEGRTQTVFGVGNPSARVLIVGEAPGKNEDLQGEPFVGAAGKYLDELLSIAGLKREEVFIANVLKCRPPGNRNPRREEIEMLLGGICASRRAPSIPSTL